MWEVRLLLWVLNNTEIYEIIRDENVLFDNYGEKKKQRKKQKRKVLQLSFIEIYGVLSQVPIINGLIDF